MEGCRRQQQRRRRAWLGRAGLGRAGLAASGSGGDCCLPPGTDQYRSCRHLKWRHPCSAAGRSMARCSVHRRRQRRAGHGASHPVPGLATPRRQQPAAPARSTSTAAPACTCLVSEGLGAGGGHTVLALPVAHDIKPPRHLVAVVDGLRSSGTNAEQMATTCAFRAAPAAPPPMRTRPAATNPPSPHPQPPSAYRGAAARALDARARLWDVKRVGIGGPAAASHLQALDADGPAAVWGVVPFDLPPGRIGAARPRGRAADAHAWRWQEAARG